MSVTIVPAQFLEITEDIVQLLCNIGTLEKPYLQTRNFHREAFEDMIKDMPQYPHNKYCNIITTIKPGSMAIDIKMVRGTKKFKRNFIKEDVFKDINLDFLKETCSD